MNVLKRDQDFKFNYHSVFDNEIGPPGAYFDPLIVNGLIDLSTEVDVGSLHFDGECTLVDHLLETRTECAMNFHRAADDSICQVILNQIAPFPARSRPISTR